MRNVNVLSRAGLIGAATAALVLGSSSLAHAATTVTPATQVRAASVAGGDSEQAVSPQGVRDAGYFLFRSDCIDRGDRGLRFHEWSSYYCQPISSGIMLFGYELFVA